MRLGWTPPRLGLPAAWPANLGASMICAVAREGHEYYHDDTAPPANSMTPTAFAAVRDDNGRILLVRRGDSGNWELPGGRVELGETASTAAEREVVEESGVTIEVTRLAGLYTDPGHVMVYPSTGEARQQFAVCFHATARRRPTPPRPRRNLRSRLDRPRGLDTMPIHPSRSGHARLRGSAAQVDTRAGLHSGATPRPSCSTRVLERRHARVPGVPVAGAPGVGKTALIDQLRPVVTGQDGWFVAGKFDQYRRDLEFDAVQQAFQALCRLLLAEPDEELAEVPGADPAGAGAERGV